MLECSPQRALSLVFQQLGVFCADEIRAWGIIRAAAGWFNGGTAGFASTEASDIFASFHKLLPLRRRPLIMEGISLSYVSDASTRKSRGCYIVVTTARRLYGNIVPQGHARAGSLDLRDSPGIMRRPKDTRHVDTWRMKLFSSGI